MTKYTKLLIHYSHLLIFTTLKSDHFFPPLCVSIIAMSPDKNKQLLLIAGPCSAESEEQVLDIGQQLKGMPLSYFRAGVWKPRTRPGSFNGIGERALPWLARMKEETGFPVIIEVAHPSHIEAALEFGIDAFWIGARTSANPFSVQEVAEALKGIDLPVFVKNPINPDIDLWIGAIERVLNAGINKIGAIHRGFSFYGKSDYRNIPRWQIPLDLKREFPDIPMLCDNSHICGKRSMLYQVAQRAMDLQFDGLMTEVHNRPDHALSDPDQQLIPKEYRALIEKLILRDVTVSKDQILMVLDDFRRQIDRVDDDLIELLGARMKLSESIGEIKQDNNISIYQPTRWIATLERAIEEGKTKELSEGFIRKLLKAIHQESISHQARAMYKNGNNKNNS